MVTTKPASLRFVGFTVSVRKVHVAGNKSRDKGAREERHIADLLGAEKVSAMHKPGHDLEMPNGDTVEVKILKDGFKSLYKWLKPVDILVVRADRQPALVVLRLEDYLELRNK